MAQTKKAYEEAKIPFAKMTFSPDVPSSALGPNEYNAGQNVEVDVRGIRSVAGDEIILKSVPGTPTYVTGGYRRPQPGKEGNDFYFVAATTEGEWYASNGMGDWQLINPTGKVFTTYNQATNITDSWNGTVPFFNDEANPPMFWPEFTGTSLPTTGASSTAGTSTITFPTQADTLGGVSIISKDGEFAFNGATVLKTGQRVDISGTNTNNVGFQVNKPKILDNQGNFEFTNTLDPVEMIGSISGTTLTVASVSSGVIYTGMLLSADPISGFVEGTRITGYTSGSPTGASVWTVSTSQTVGLGTAITGQLQYDLVEGQTVLIQGTITNTDTTLSNVKINDSFGDFQCDATTISQGQSVEVSGTLSVAPETLTTVVIDDIAGTFSCDAATGTLRSGQSVEVSGTVSTSPYTLSTVQITGATATFSCATNSLAVGQVVTISGTNTNTSPIVLGNVNIASNDGDFTCDNAGLSVGQSVIISGTNTSAGFGLTGVTVTGTAGQFACTASASLIVAGQSVTVSGADTGFTLSGVSIVGTAGQFTCTASSSLLVVGQFITISGPFGGTGSITTPAYVNPTTYAISATNGSTTFTLTDTSGGALVTTVGTPTGITVNVNTQSIFGYSNPTTYLVSTTNGSTTFTLTSSVGTPLVTNPGTPLSIGFAVDPAGISGYTNPKTYKVSATNGSNTFTLTEATGGALVTSLGIPSGLIFTVQAPAIVGYSDPTSYVIIATDGTTTFTLANLSGSPVSTLAGTPVNLTFTVEAAEITGYSDPTTYIIATTNGSTEFTLEGSDGQSISTRGGATTGLTFVVLATAIVDYTDPTVYTVSATNGTTTFRLVNSTTGTTITTVGGVTTGLTFKIKAPGIVGYTNPTTYYIKQTNGNTYFQLMDSAGTVITTTGGTPSGTISIRPRAPSITGYTNPSSYYITAVNGNNEFTLSATPGGVAIATNAGTPVGLTYTYSPFGVGQEILVEGIVPVGFRGTHTITGVSMSSVSFAGTTAGPQTVTGAVSDPYPLLIQYSNAVPVSLTDIRTDPDNTDYQIIVLETPLTAAPYSAGEQIIISDVNNYFNGLFTVVSSTTTTITYKGIPGANYPGGTGTVSALYTWNYNPNWSSLYAKFMRLYNTPNVGSILVAGGLTAVSLDGTIEEYPVTVRWSQPFALNEAPKTWEPTVTNVANELEVPLRGAVVDAFPCNGQLFLSSVWDTVVFSPINYATTSAPILGVRLANQGRGMLTSNCWANTDKMVYGIDARDIWQFDGQNFTGLGNQRIKNWLFSQFDPAHVDRVYMETNTQKNQVEIYYPTKPPIAENISIVSTDGKFSCTVQSNEIAGQMRTGLQVYLSGTETGSGSISGYNPVGTLYYVVDVDVTGTIFQLSTTPEGAGVTTTLGSVTGVDFNFVSDGVPNMMIAYRHDLDCFNAPREVQAATMACEAPYWTSQAYYQNTIGTNIVATGSGAHFNILRSAVAYLASPTPNVRGTGYSVGDTILVTGDQLGGETPANDATLTVTATESGGKIDTLSATGEPLDTWLYNSGLRTVVYARGLTNRTLVQKDDGYNFLGPQLREYPVNSLFRRDNIKILPDYSGKLLVHRILPEINNLDKFNVPINERYQGGIRIGSVDIKIEGANSVGQDPLQTTAETIATNTNYPWVQINQNAHRVNSIELSNSSTQNIWICNATTWQFTQTEDDR